MNITVVPCIRAGLCNRLLILNTLLNYHKLFREKVGLRYHWHVMRDDNHAAYYAPFHSAFRAGGLFGIMDSDAPYVPDAGETVVRKPKDCSFSSIQDALQYVVEERLIEDYLERMFAKLGYRPARMLVMGRGLHMTELTGQYYTRLEAEHLATFRDRQLVFVRCNSDIMDVFNSKVGDEAIGQLAELDNPFYIYDTTDSASYGNMLRRIPAMDGADTLNMFSFSEDKTERFYYMVALLFLALQAGRKIINLNHKSSYGNMLAFNSECSREQ